MTGVNKQTNYSLSRWVEGGMLRMLQKKRYQIYYRIAAGLFFATLIAVIFFAVFPARPYRLNDAGRAVLPKQNQSLAKFLEYDNKTKTYKYNQSYTGRNSPENGLSGTGAPRINAYMSKDPAKGVTVKDPLNSVDVTLKPKFRVKEGSQDNNQIFYQLGSAQGYLVYTSQITGIKEDIVLGNYTQDKLVFEYEIGLKNGLEARKEVNGAIGVYGSDLPINGEVSTGTENDKLLLEKARKSNSKNKLLFTLPAPVVVETGKTVSQVKAYFELEGTFLRLVTKQLKGASYPLSIDPSIYVETAQKLMRGNNETNLDFDVSNELIQKGKLTGARFNAWNSSLALPAARRDAATATYGGYAYSVGGNSGSSDTATVYWAKFNTTTGAIEAPNPGNGACASWCTDSVYNLPETRVGHTLTAYNGYLHVIGGLNGATRSPKIYIAKLGLNGEPSLWHPTDTNKANWVYWYQDTSLGTERSYAGAVAYNNSMYLIGGQSIATTGGLTTVERADIKPTGTLGSWATTGMVALPAGRHNHSVQVYNDRLYVIGGANASTTQTTVYYIKVNNDGTLAGSAWATTTALPSARAANGGNFTTIWGGYIYAAGGCSTFTSLVCTADANVINNAILASINADGTISDWQTLTGLTSKRMGYGFVSWRGVLYGIGGCTAMTGSSCSTTTANTSYGVINQDGDASSVRSSVANGTSPCDAAGGWRDCDLPPEGSSSGQGGRMSGGTVVNNGFIYYIGGCTAVGASNVCFTGNSGKASDNISYASVRSDGVIVRVASCTGGTLQFVGSWCVDNTNTVNAASGLAAFAVTAFNNTIYVVGGTTGTTWQTNIWRITPTSSGALSAGWTSQTFAAVGITDDAPGQTGNTSRGYSYAFTRSNPSSAGTNPGNLYVLGGCTGPSGAIDNGLNCDGANSQYSSVYKCNISTDTSLNGCTTSGQLTIDSEPGTAGTQGLGVMAGAVYANYVYLVGGQSPSQSDRGQVMYAKIDNNNNIVAASGSIWTTSPNEVSPARRRGVAFGYNGYLYTIAGYASGTSLNDLLFSKINTSDGSIGTFATSNVTVDARWDLRAIVNNGYVYTMGGCSVGDPPSNCTTMTGNVQVFQLFNNYSGAPALYSASANLFATDRMGHATAVLNGYIYVAGGCTGLGDCTVTTNNSQFAAISSTGVVGAWANTTDSTLPANRGWGKMVAAGGSLYFVGGQDLLGVYSSEVYYATPSTSTGNISSWSTATNGLPAARTKHGAAVWNNRLYVIGGYNGSAVQNTVYVSPQLTNGGDITSAWTSTTGFNVARSGVTAITYANNIYALGGSTDNGTTITGDVQYAKINTDGTISSGAWSYTSSLADKLYGADGFAYNGFMYLFGGRSSAETCETNTIAAPISANTTIASGNNPTGVGEWFETNEKYVGSRYGAQAVYWDGKAYITGGGCGSTLTYTGANRVVQTTLLMQPQVAKYSRMIDTDTDVFPTKWLMNGLDNSTGAEWYLKYRSMTDIDGIVNPNEDCGVTPTSPAMSTWGTETNFGKVTLGNPEIYTPRDASNGNTNCARYLYFSINIDSTQAFGYPEDVTRGPTIADLTLFFTADPSKRLHHGKTFTGGELQPLNTPF